MPRAKNNVAAHQRHRKVLKKARGNYSGRRKLYRTALETVNKGLKYAYRDRRNKKREMRSLWITRISAAAKMCGTNYSTMINGLHKSGVEMDRKMLADIAARDMTTFKTLANMATGK
ncbi:50S ribosomal protein L20 [candidate division GN15 bacterium]|nr:50S ribosomal protein L20 [candidate division GN15 bacterium]